MAVMLRLQRDGTLRSCWYGEFTDARGTRVVTNLNVPWKGKPPESGSLTDAGDALFEKSRATAKEELAKFKEEAVRKGRAAHLTERLIEIKTGAVVEHVRIAELGERWRATRTKAASAAHAFGSNSACERFRLFMAERNSGATYLYEVTAEDATAFYQGLCKEMAPRTAHGYAAVIRSACKRFLPEGSVNPFRNVSLSGGKDSVHRKPFTADELRRILDTARDDGFMYPLIVAAACSGMRRGDVCGLRWEDVDLNGGMLTAKSSKTGEPLEIPIFGPLREVLEARRGNEGELVFPEAAEMLASNPYGLSYRFKAVVAKALDTERTSPAPHCDAAAAVAEEGAEAVRRHMPDGKRRKRVLDTFARYCEGESVRDIETATGRTKGTISNDLHAVETWTGKRFIRTAGSSLKASIARVTRVNREQGKLSASVRDWHALRTTFVTLALSAGVPIELVKRVTGHTTVDVVLRHYFRPGREEFRAALAGAMPAVLTGGDATLDIGKSKLGGEGLAKAHGPQSELVVLAGKVAAGTATKAEKARLGKMLAGA